MSITELLKVSASFLLSTSLLLGCGGGSSGSGTSTTEAEAEEDMNTPALYTGVFVDAPVQGLRYQTASQSGTTNVDGEYTYQLGEQVTFSIGDITFPETEASSQITPLNIFDTDDVNHLGVTNMLRLLQTLDVDGIPENGIELDAQLHTLAANLTIDFTSADFDSSVEALILNNNAVNISLISAEAAILHFNEELNLSSSSCGLDHEKVGFTGSFNTLAHDVTGDAEVIDNCTISITNFNYDATAPAVYFYANNLTSNPFTIGDELRNNSEDYRNASIVLTLPNGKTLDDIDNLSVWCVDFSVSFGNMELSAP